MEERARRIVETAVELAEQGGFEAVRLRDVDEAQALLVNLAKDLAAKGEILIAKSRGDDEMIY